MKERNAYGPAWLPNDRLRRNTLHRFERTELKTIRRDGHSVTGLAHIYRCTETDIERQWGFDVTYARDNGGN